MRKIADDTVTVESAGTKPGPRSTDFPQKSSWKSGSTSPTNPRNSSQMTSLPLLTGSSSGSRSLTREDPRANSPFAVSA